MQAFLARTDNGRKAEREKSCAVSHFAAQCKNKRSKNKLEKRDDSKRDDSTLLSICLQAANRSLTKAMWCIDSGASSHLCCIREMFTEYVEENESITIPGENRMYAVSRGNVRLVSEEFNVTLTDVLHVPGLQCNFVSVGKAADRGATVSFGDSDAVIRRSGKIVFKANKVGDLYLHETHTDALYFSCVTAENAYKWHDRNGHLNPASMKQLVSKEMVRGMQLQVPEKFECVVCMKCKATRKPFTTSESRAAELLETIHSDLCGPMNVTSMGGSKYVLTFIDDKSRYVFIYLLKGKHKVLESFKDFKTCMELQTGKKIKILRSDKGREYVNGPFNAFLKSNGIVHQLSVPYTPQQNGVAERMNRTLIEMARCMLVGAGLN